MLYMFWYISQLLWNKELKKKKTHQGIETDLYLFEFGIGAGTWCFYSVGFAEGIHSFNFDLQGADNLRKFQLNELEELRNEAYVSTRNDKERMKLFHDKSIVRKNFEKNQQVLLYDSRLDRKSVV